MFGQEERETVMRSDRHKKAKNKKTTAIIVVAVLVVVLIGVGIFAATHRGDKPTPVTKKVTKDAAGEVNPLTGETVKASSLPSKPIVVSGSGAGGASTKDDRAGTSTPATAE